MKVNHFLLYLAFCWFLCPCWGRFLFLLRLLLRLFWSRLGFLFRGPFCLLGLCRISWMIPLTLPPLFPLWPLILFFGFGRFGFWSRWACFLLDFLFPRRFERLFLVLMSALVKDGFLSIERKIFFRLIPLVSRWCIFVDSIWSAPTMKSYEWYYCYLNVFIK